MVFTQSEKARLVLFHSEHATLGQITFLNFASLIYTTETTATCPLDVVKHERSAHWMPCVKHEHYVHWMLCVKHERYVHWMSCVLKHERSSRLIRQCKFSVHAGAVSQLQGSHQEQFQNSCGHAGEEEGSPVVLRTRLPQLHGQHTEPRAGTAEPLCSTSLTPPPSSSGPESK